MKKTITSILLIAAVLAAMPAWSGERKHDRGNYKEYDYSHRDKHSSRHWKKRYSPGHAYDRGRSYHKKRYYRNHRYDHFPSYGYYPRRHHDDGHWSIMLRYVD